MIPLSVLDLAPILEGRHAGGRLSATRCDLAQHAERLGYRRFWLAEHHNMPGYRERGHGGAHRRTWGRAPRASGSAPAASCCRTTRRCRWPSSSARSRRCSPAASISASGARRAPIHGRRDRLRRTLQRRSRQLPQRRDRADGVSGRPSTWAGRARGAGRRPAGAHLDSRVQHVRRAGGRGARACRSRSPHISRPRCSSRRSGSIASASSRRPSSPSRT